MNDPHNHADGRLRDRRFPRRPRDNNADERSHDSHARGHSHVRDLTKGAIGKSILLFSLPLLASSLIQLLYSTVDLMFVGNFIGAQAAAAVGSSVLIVTCVLGFFTGLGIGTGVVAAQQFGAGDHPALDRSIHAAMALGLYGGGILTPLLILISPALLTLLNTPSEIIGDATVYLRIYFLSLIPMICYNMGSGVLRALGNSRSPMRCQLVGGICNVAANALFVCALQWGVMGSALATLCSQTIAAILVVRLMRKLDDSYRLRFRDIRFHRSPTQAILRIGVPASVQAMVITLSNLVVQYFINSLGVTDIAAFTAFFKVENFIYLPIMALGQTVTMFVGQNMGAALSDRAREGMYICILIGLTVTGGIAALLLGFCPWVLRMFTGDAAVIEVGTQIAFFILPLYFIYVFLEVIGSAIRGTGRPLPPMIITLSMICGLRIVLLNAFPAHFSTPRAVASLYPITWGAATICLLLYYFIRRKSIWKTVPPS